MKKFILLISLLIMTSALFSQETVQFKRTYNYIDFWDNNISEWGYSPNTDVNFVVIFNYKHQSLYTKIIDIKNDPPILNSLIRPLSDLVTDEEAGTQYYIGEDPTGDSVLVMLNDNAGVFMISYGEKSGMRFIDTELFKKQTHEDDFNLY